MLYLINVYVTFIFIKAILDKLNTSFSDGLNIRVKFMVMILLVVPVYIEFTVAGYKSDVTKSIRL